MERKYMDDRISVLLVLACFITYTAICMTKNSYSAAVAAIVQENLFPKAKIGAINSMFLLFYGSMQLIGGTLADKKSPFAIVIVAVIGSAISNLIMSCTQSYMVMLITWSFNGFIQFGMWPSMIKIVSTVLKNEYRQKALVLLPFGMSAGTMLSYLTATLVLGKFRWPSLFFTSFIILFVVAVLFAFVAYRISKLKSAPDDGVTAKVENSNIPIKTDVSLGKLIFKSGLLLLLIPAFVRSMLQSGLTSWTPTMLMESYGVSVGVASTLMSVMSVVNLTGVFWVILVYPKRCKNLSMVITMLFAVVFPFVTMMMFIGKISIAFIIISVAVITTLGNSGNQIFNVILPTEFYHYGKIGAIAGIVNAFACFGGFIANILFGFLADKYGWNSTILSWVALDVLALILSMIAIPVWKHFTREGVN